MSGAGRLRRAPSTGTAHSIEVAEKPIDGRQGSRFGLEGPLAHPGKQRSDRSGTRDLFQFRLVANHVQFTVWVKPESQVASGHLRMKQPHLREIGAFLFED